MKTKPLIGIQLDLKGMRFKPRYAPQYLADLASQGINTLLVEYEDALPFEGLSIASDPTTVWSPAALRRKVCAHFGRRYVGAAFEERLRHLFDLHDERLHAATNVCRMKQHTARHHYE